LYVSIGYYRYMLISVDEYRSPLSVKFSNRFLMYDVHIGYYTYIGIV